VGFFTTLAVQQRWASSRHTITTPTEQLLRPKSHPNVTALADAGAAFFALAPAAKIPTRFKLSSISWIL
jgi:hypothetical protein